MKCIACSKKASVHTSTGDYCIRCFSRRIEKRIRKYARLSKVINPKLKIVCLDEVTHHIVHSMFKGAKIRIRLLKRRPKASQGTVILEKWTLDDEINDFLFSLMHNKKTKEKSRNSILIVATDDELLKFAMYHKLGFVPNKKDRQVQKIIEGMSNKYPETKYALSRSVKNIQEIMKKK